MVAFRFRLTPIVVVVTVVVVPVILATTSSASATLSLEMSQRGDSGSRKKGIHKGIVTTPVYTDRWRQSGARYANPSHTTNPNEPKKLHALQEKVRCLGG